MNAKGAHAKLDNVKWGRRGLVVKEALPLGAFIISKRRTEKRV